MATRRNLLTTTALATFGSIWLAELGFGADLVTKAPVLYATSLDAVSGVNAKIGGFGGWQDASGGVFEKDRAGGLGGAEGSLTVPIGHSFGLQADTTAGVWGGDAFYGVGGHGFWRDPNVGLLGVSGAWMQLDRGPWPFLPRGRGISYGNVGLEGERYWGSFTLRGVAGWEGGDITNRFFTRADVRWYAQKDLMLSLGYRYTGGKSAAALGTEWLAPANVLGGRASLFAEARIGESNNRAVLGGLRLYFGKSDTLIDKHRRDDPGNDLPDNLFTLQQFSRSLDKQDKANHPVTLDKQDKANHPVTLDKQDKAYHTVTYASDTRLKRDIALLGRLDDGLGIYRYRYLWDDTLYVGVMAQEVIALQPDAVELSDQGYLHVDYERLGLRLTQWDEWHSGLAA